MESPGHTAETVAQAFIRAIHRQDVHRLSDFADNEPIRKLMAGG